MTCTQTDVGCLPDDPINFVAKFYVLGLGIIGAVAIISMVYGGYILMTSNGNPDRINLGKSYIFYAIAGLILAILGFAFVQIVVIDALHIPGFGI